VLLILSDDLRPQLGCYGDTVVKTPHLDRFAESALICDRAYVQCAICSPSRNSLLSGLAPWTTGLYGFGTSIRQAVPDVVTLPQHFRTHGYHAAAIGKVFHVYAETILGSEDDSESWSEPLVLPQRPVWGPEQNALRNRLTVLARAEGRVFQHPHDWPRAGVWDDPDVPDDDLQDGEIAANAVTFLREHADDEQPFFLAVGFLKPHLPFVAPRKYWGWYDAESLPLPENRYLPRGAPAWAINQGTVRNFHGVPALEELDDAYHRRFLQAYLACISYVDACAGRVLRAVDELGLRERTIVVFLGDHGYQMGEHDSWGHKHSNFETSTRAPLLVRAPEMSAAGRHTTSLIEFLDVYPTLCELAKLPVPGHAEGSSFAALLEDPDRVVHTIARSAMQRGPRHGRAIRTDRFRYVAWTDADGRQVAEELYDHQHDPHENENVIEVQTYRPHREQLQADLQQAFPAN
jgi:arylsulfatase A-like enzyme